MRNFQNNSLIRFFHGNLPEHVNEPRPAAIKARPGDIIRTLVNKYEVGSDNYRDISVCLLPLENPFVTPIFERAPVATIPGSVRVQAAENFSHFRLKVNNFVPNKYRQFSIKVDGKYLIFPFSYSGSSITELMQSLSDALDSTPNIVTRTKVNGSIIDVYMNHSSRFRLSSDISIVLGEVSAVNQNAPTLTGSKLSEYTKGANKDYEMIVKGTLIEGNKFIFTSSLKKGRRIPNIHFY